MKELLSVLKEIVPLAKDIIIAVAAIIAAYIGIQGLGTWRRQLKGNTEYQLAKNILTAVYELREAISIVRHSFMQYPQEPDLPKEKLKELSEREKNWYALAQAYQKRWEPVPAAKAKLDANLLEAEAVWGRSILNKVMPLNGLIAELLWAIQDHMEARNPNVDYESPGREEIKKRHEIMYACSDSEKDEYKKRFEAVVYDIESELKPRIVQYHR